MNRHARLDEHQNDVAARVLEHEAQHRTHLVIHLSGAHAYGFPSTDSDLDLKAVHIEPTRNLLRLNPPKLVFNRLEVIDDVEIDYTSNELSKCVANLLSGDGNMLERVLSTTPMETHPALDELSELARGAISKRFERHYNGFAHSQHARLKEASEPTAKKLLYVLRTALTGTHLLLEGECNPDLTDLYGRYGFPEVEELIEIKQAEERGALPKPWRPKVPELVERAFGSLDEATRRSPLPDEAPNRDRLEDWLLETRKQTW